MRTNIINFNQFSPFLSLLPLSSRSRSHRSSLPFPSHASCFLLPASNSKGFTFIEILITLTVIAILFVPTMQLFSNTLYATADSLDIITATNLAKSEMEKIINLNLSETRLKEIGSAVYPSEKEPPLTVNGVRWRVRKEAVEGTDPLEIRIRVFKDENPTKEIASLVTLVEDMMWEIVTPVSGEI